jgi:hypothetical protein
VSPTPGSISDAASTAPRLSSKAIIAPVVLEQRCHLSAIQLSPGRPLCRAYDGAQMVISISYGLACILPLIRRASCAGCWKIRHDRTLLASGQVS